MISFVDDKPSRLVFGNDWIDIKSSLSFEDFRVFFKNKEDSLENILPALKKVVVAWSFNMPVSPENIEKLTYASVMELGVKVLALYTPEKKSSTQSQPESSTESKPTV